MSSSEDASANIIKIFKETFKHPSFDKLKKEIGDFHQDGNYEEIKQSLKKNLLGPTLMAMNLSTIISRNKYDKPEENNTMIENLTQLINQIDETDQNRDIIKLLKCLRINILRAELECSYPGFYEGLDKIMNDYHSVQVLRSLF